MIVKSRPQIKNRKPKGYKSFKQLLPKGSLILVQSGNGPSILAGNSLVPFRKLGV